MSLDYDFIASTAPIVLKALPMTVLLTVVPVTLGLLLGFILALFKIHRVPVLCQFASVYLSIFRGVPLLLMLFIAYYGLPKLLNILFFDGYRVMSPNKIPGVTAALIMLTLHSAAYLCEIVRGALGSVDMKQMEAAHAIGMTKLQAYTRIIIPQAIVVCLPNCFNFVLGLLKKTSLVFTIAVMDIMTAAKIAAEEGYRFIEAYLLVGIIYIICSFVLYSMFRCLEARAKRQMGMY